MRRGAKRKVALAFAAAVLALAGGAVLALRTLWAGERLCALAEARARAVTGLPLSVGACRIDPFRLELVASDVRLGPERAPILAVERVRARLRPVQALGRRIELAEVELVAPRLDLALPPQRPGEPPAPCPPPALSRLQVHRLAVERGAVALTLPGGERIEIGRFEIRSVPPARPRGLAALRGPGPPRAGLSLAVADARLDAGGRHLELAEARLDADLALDLSRLDVHLLAAEVPGATLLASGAVEELCRPRLDLAAALEGEVPRLAALAGARLPPSEGRVALDVALKGPAARPVVEGQVRLAGVRLGAFRPGDATARVRLAGDEVRVEKLELPTLGGRVAARGVIRLGREIGLEAEAALERVELGEIFARLGLPGAWVMLRVDGKARVAGTAWPLRLAGEAGLDVSDFRVLSHGWETFRPGEPAFLEARRGRVDGPVRIDAAGVHLEAVKAHVGAGVATTRGVLHFDGDRGFELAVEGGVDLSELRHLGPVPVGGLAQVDGVLVRAAPYGNPHVEGRARVQGFRFLDLDLGEASAALRYDDFVLSVAGVHGRRGATLYEGEARIDLGAEPVRITSARYAAQGRLRDLFEAAMPWQPKARYARDVLDGDVTVHGTASGPAEALDARFEGELGAGTLAGRAFDAGRFAGRVEAGERATFERAELRRGPGVAHGSGTVGFAAPFPWELEASAAGVKLGDLGLPGTGWAGTMSGTASLSGSYEVPKVRFAGNADAVAVRDVPIGSVQLGGRLEGASLALTGSGAGLRLTGTAQTSGDMPFEARAEVDVEDVTRFLPGGPPAGLRARARGVASARGALADLGHTRGELRLDEVRGGYADFRVDAAEPVVLALEDGRVVVRSFTMRGANTQFSMTGACEPSGALALDARGALDLRLLGGLLAGVVQPRGQLALEGHVGGTLSEPLLVGAGRLRDAGFQIRDTGIVFTGLAGDLAFSQNRVLFDRLAAAVNGGRAQLDGEVELTRFFPSRVRVAALLDEVPLRLPEYLPSVVAGQLLAAGTWDEMLLSGKLHVVRALYSDRVDLEKRIVEVQRKKVVQRPFDKAGEWLRLDIGLVVDGDARIDNDLVRGAMKGELTVTGSLAAVGLLGTLTMTEGSRATFRGNDFVLTHAVVDFSDRRKVRMSLDVHGEAVVRDYQVYMHLFGPYEDPSLQLTSQPALSQQDIVTLLSLGFTTRDASASAGVTGAATAAAAQALFSASGLDDQVKRFVPRGGLLRDFSVRITSAYSEGTGQVEPRAEFESRVLDSRLRLRYQAPLSGARGQRAQAEMRLGTHTSLQYQWDNDSPDVLLYGIGDHGLDLKLRWEWSD
jgi:translocation and assembly module TamB